MKRTEMNAYLKSTRMWRGYLDYERYRAEDEYELLEYYKIEPNRSGLNVRIWVDDGHSYIAHRHPMWLYAEIDGLLVPISICKYPQVMLPTWRKYNIESIRQFIVNNLENIKKLANEEIENIVFGRTLFIHLNESVLNEMSKMKPSVTGLPVVLWVDEGTHPKHSWRIKFRASAEQHNSSEYSSMTIESEPQVFNLPRKGCIDSHTVELIKKFVIYNKDLLIALYKGEINYESYFLSYVIKIDKNGEPIYPDTMLDKPQDWKPYYIENNIEFDEDFHNYE